MNAVLAVERTSDINPCLAYERLAEAFQARQRVHVANFLTPQFAEALCRHLVENVAYRTYVIANQEEMATPPGEDSTLTSDDERELFELACDGARNGFVSYFEADRSLSDPPTRSDSSSPYDSCTELLTSAEFLAFARGITGNENLHRVELHATRFRAGHFVTFNSGTNTADVTGKRRINFELNLTSQWRPEWGGMLEMRGREGHEVEATMPCFNSLELFSFPKGHWISQVTPFALASRYAIAGAIYID